MEELEISAAKVLDGRGRDLCLKAFQACPRGFAAVADRALREGRNPIGLLVWMVERRHHERLEAALSRQNSTLAERRACFVCGAEGELEYAGQHWCEEHLAEQRSFDAEVAL